MSTVTVIGAPKQGGRQRHVPAGPVPAPASIVTTITAVPPQPVVTSKQVPFVIVLDLDGTIVGDVTSHINEWVICKFLNATAISNFHKTMRWHLKNGLLRPYFQQFMNAAYKDHGIEVFVYTASTKDWAPVVISNVEKVTGHNFNRPIFTRDSCIEQRGGNLKKSLEKIKPKIFERLKRKYVALQSPKDLDGRMCMIDNTDVLIEKWAWIPCPTYDFVTTHDILKHIDWEILRDQYQSIHKELVAQEALSRSSGVRDFDGFMAAYYSRIARRLSSNSTKNYVEKQDTFWKVCTENMFPIISHMKARSDVTPYVVRSILRVMPQAKVSS